jgi:hypothetical protein
VTKGLESQFTGLGKNDAMKSLTEHLWFEVPQRRGYLNITDRVQTGFQFKLADNSWNRILGRVPWRLLVVAGFEGRCR